MVEKKDRGRGEGGKGGKKAGAQRGWRANPTMRFAFLCTGVVRNFVVARVFRRLAAAFRARDEKPRSF